MRIDAFHLAPTPLPCLGVIPIAPPARGRCVESVCESVPDRRSPSAAELMRAERDRAEEAARVAGHQIRRAAAALPMPPAPGEPVPEAEHRTDLGTATIGEVLPIREPQTRTRVETVYQIRRPIPAGISLDLLA